MSIASQLEANNCEGTRIRSARKFIAATEDSQITAWRDDSFVPLVAWAFVKHPSPAYWRNCLREGFERFRKASRINGLSICL